MSRVKCSVIAIVALIVTAAAERGAGADEALTHAKPSSFAPRGRPGPRTYGAPIQGPVQGPVEGPVMKRRSPPRPSGPPARTALARGLPPGNHISNSQAELRGLPAPQLQDRRNLSIRTQGV
jgi:hypothetical protein